MFVHVRCSAANVAKPLTRTLATLAVVSPCCHDRISNFNATSAINAPALAVVLGRCVAESVVLWLGLLLHSIVHLQQAKAAYEEATPWPMDPLQLAQPPADPELNAWTHYRRALALLVEPGDNSIAEAPMRQLVTDVAAVSYDAEFLADDYIPQLIAQDWWQAAEVHLAQAALSNQRRVIGLGPTYLNHPQSSVPSVV